MFGILIMLNREIEEILPDIEAAKKRRAEPESRMREYFERHTYSFRGTQGGSIEVVCPFAIGTANGNSPEYEGMTLCGFYGNPKGCTGYAQFFGTQSPTAFMFGGRQAIYQCKGTGKRVRMSSRVLDAVFHWEMEGSYRRNLIKQVREGHALLEVDAELAKRLSSNVHIAWLTPEFKVLVYELVQQKAIDWLNTINQHELEDLYEDENVLLDSMSDKALKSHLEDHKRDYS